jgi:hypothetical protein
LRVETKRLLDRLGQPEFQYREYGEAQPSHVERWPLFELTSRQLHPNRISAGRRTVEARPNEAADDKANSIQSLASRISIGLGR